MSVTSQRSTLPKPGWMPSLASHSSRMSPCFYLAMNSVTMNGSSHIWRPIMVVLNLCLLCMTAMMWTTTSFISGHWVLQRKICVSFVIVQTFFINNSLRSNICIHSECIWCKKLVIMRMQIFMLCN